MERDRAREFELSILERARGQERYQSALLRLGRKNLTFLNLKGLNCAFGADERPLAELGCYAHFWRLDYHC